MKVAVLGAAGGIGQALSLLLKTQLPAGSELSLYDVAPVVPGVAVDLSHIPTAVKVTGFGADSLNEALVNADIVLIDETIGYNIAKSQSLNVQRTLSFLIASNEKRLY